MLFVQYGHFKSLPYNNRVYRANLPAGIALDAKFCVDDVLFMGLEWNRINRASLDTQRAANAIVVDRIIDQGRTFTCRTNTVQMGFVLLPEIFKRA